VYQSIYNVQTYIANEYITPKTYLIHEAQQIQSFSKIVLRRVLIVVTDVHLKQPECEEGQLYRQMTDQSQREK